MVEADSIKKYAVKTRRSQIDPIELLVRAKMILIEQAVGLHSALTQPIWIVSNTPISLAKAILKLIT